MTIFAISPPVAPLGEELPPMGAALSQETGFLDFLTLLDTNGAIAEEVPPLEEGLEGTQEALEDSEAELDAGAYGIVQSQDPEVFTPQHFLVFEPKTLPLEPVPEPEALQNESDTGLNLEFPKKLRETAIKGNEGHLEAHSVYKALNSASKNSLGDPLMQRSQRRIPFQTTMLSAEGARVDIPYPRTFRAPEIEISTLSTENLTFFNNGPLEPLKTGLGEAPTHELEAALLKLIAEDSTSTVVEAPLTQTPKADLQLRLVAENAYLKNKPVTLGSNPQSAPVAAPRGKGVESPFQGWLESPQRSLAMAREGGPKLLAASPELLETSGFFKQNASSTGEQASSFSSEQRERGHEQPSAPELKLSGQLSLASNAAAQGDSSVFQKGSSSEASLPAPVQQHLVATMLDHIQRLRESGSSWTRLDIPPTNADSRDGQSVRVRLVNKRTLEVLFDKTSAPTPWLNQVEGGWGRLQTQARAHGFELEAPRFS